MGLQIIDLSNLPNSATLVTTFTGFSSMHNIYIDEDNAILYASPGSGADPAIAYSLANPVNPVQLSTFGIHNHDAYARNNIVYLSEGWDGSFSIYDLSTPSSPNLLVRYTIPSAGYVHNAWLTDDGNYLMTTEETSGKTIKLWDVQDLSNITLKSEYLVPNELAHNTHIKGDYAYISHYGAGLRIVDISDPNAISEEGYYDTADAWGAWPYFNSGKVLISDITDGLYVVYFAGAVIIPTAIEEEPEAPQDFSVSRIQSQPGAPDDLQFSWPESAHPGQRFPAARFLPGSMGRPR
jgi:choice-of-anchor B domain-containing protein